MILRWLSSAAFILIVAGVCAPVLADDPAPAKTQKPQVPEFARMLGSILVHGSDMGPTSGWFHPSECRYSWAWLAEKFDRDKNGALKPEEMKGSASLFRALDRDGDGEITAEDLNWTPSSRYLQGRAQARGQFSRMDPNGNGRISLEEWEKAFERAAKGKTFVTQDDLADWLYPPQRRPATEKGKAAPPSGPSRWTLLKDLFSGEIGSPHEGPNIGQEAPGFVLETHDKERRISLADYRGKKPVVLIFGSFT
jgi:Ca2+-binding EF-hand superfamily protein